MPTALVFGARGQIGRFLLPRLQAACWRVHAVSRGAATEASSAALEWHQLDLFGADPPALAADVVFSLGPLDGLVHWLERAPVVPPRLIAFGSTSALTKRESPDEHERRLSASLRQSELALARACEARSCRWTLLRPTLVYGVAMDRNLTRIARVAQRWHGFVLPRSATGLRQPVHADDLAAAAWSAAQHDASAGRGYDLPGGETLPYREMVSRVLACLDPPPKLFLVSALTFGLALRFARLVGAVRDAGEGVVARLQEDLVFDRSHAALDLDYAPRPFKPQSTMFIE